jgi:broad specificity phosphatase PhoE
VADQLRELSIELVAVSPVRRAMQTTELIGPLTDLPATQLPWLREYTYPNWEGWEPKIVGDLLKEYKGSDTTEQWAGLSGGESNQEYIEKVHTGARGWLAGHGVRPDESDPGLWTFDRPLPRVAFVGHAGSLSSLIALLLGLNSVPWERQRFRLAHASVTIIDSITVGTKKAFGLELLGDNLFLPEPLRTR